MINKSLVATTTNREQRLLDAVKRLMNKMKSVQKKVDAIYVSAAVHGVRYEGATYGEELKKVKEILKEYERN